MVRIATWNVNSVKQRVPRLLLWLDERQPDIVCLQETKLGNEAFTALFGAELSQRGYDVALHGEAQWNGVAILSRVGLDDVVKGAASNSALSLEATGSIVPFCYPAALSPYRCVLVKISDSQFSTRYVITQVTHTLTRSIYTQSFSMKGNGVTVAAGGNASAPQPSASFTASFNIQGSIF